MSNLRDSWNDVKAALKGVLTLLKQNDPKGYEEAVREVRTLGTDLLRDIEELNDYEVKVYTSGIFDDKHVAFASVPGKNSEDILWDILPVYHETEPAPFFKWMWEHNAHFTSKGELVFTPYPEDIEKAKKKMDRLAKEPSYTALANDEEVQGVIIITDEIKKNYLELKNLKMIQKESSDYMTWKDSMQYAKDLDLGGFNDWRLPTIEELRSIYKAKQALGIPADYHWYWSGSKTGASLAWGVGFNSSGNVLDTPKGYTLYARCVR